MTTYYCAVPSPFSPQETARKNLHDAARHRISIEYAMSAIRGFLAAFPGTTLVDVETYLRIQRLELYLVAEEMGTPMPAFAVPTRSTRRLTIIMRPHKKALKERAQILAGMSDDENLRHLETAGSLVVGLKDTEKVSCVSMTWCACDGFDTIRNNTGVLEVSTITNPFARFARFTEDAKARVGHGCMRVITGGGAMIIFMAMRSGIAAHRAGIVVREGTAYGVDIRYAEGGDVEFRGEWFSFTFQGAGMLLTPIRDAPGAREQPKRSVCVNCNCFDDMAAIAPNLCYTCNVAAGNGVCCVCHRVVSQSDMPGAAEHGMFYGICAGCVEQPREVGDTS